MLQRQLPALPLAAAIAGTIVSGCATANNTVTRQAARSTTGQYIQTPVVHSTPVNPQSKSQLKTMKIKLRLKLEETTLNATLDDNATSRDFVALLPLTLTLTDYAETEKISDLPKRLSTKGAPAGSTPSAGDITYYAPWGNLAVFHKDFSYSSGLVKLGRIDSGMEALSGTGPLKVTIERMKN